ncbi:hypothetical protein MNBD_ALPHA08-156 [hydrothermal vent metagenome]|uniref:CobQ/CobB/MinD/ParA nucleotide binding domain-containing protein n=1 Tax=hydrothermal vent metagenome TaxID=652676 RepID=A0A3B0SFY2_9ZZZZ
MEQKSHIYIVCSDQTRNGKTLFARLLADFLLVQGGKPFVIDLDAPTGGICDYFPEISEVFDVASVPGQMELFDWILGTPGRDYVLDVPARYLDKLFTVMDDINFLEGAGAQGFEINVFYLVEGSVKSLTTAQMMHDNFTVDRFFVVRHEAMDEDLKDFKKLSLFNNLIVQGQIVLPKLDGDVLDEIEDEAFSFCEFIGGEESDMDAKIQFKLASFLEVVIAGIQRVKRRIDIGHLQKIEPTPRFD